MKIETLGGYVNGRPILSDYADVINTTHWLMVLASPSLYRTLDRMPTREHLVLLMDIYLAYVGHDGRYSDAEHKPVPYKQREALAARLRALLETWTPPDLPLEITEVARELLYAEGRVAPNGGWDSLTITGPDRLEDVLLWPEGIPALLRERAEGHRPSGSPDVMQRVFPPQPLQPEERDLPVDFMDAIAAIHWLMVLAAPQVYRELGRTPPREHLLLMLDLYSAYAGQGHRYSQASFEPVPYEHRVSLAAKLRALMEVWTLPELPSEITEAAREVLYAEGVKLVWDKMTTRIVGTDCLRWPEGIPAQLRYEAERQRAATDKP
jgi:hypothetical protein